MESITGTSVQPSLSAELAASVIKDTTGAQLINKTLEQLNAVAAQSGTMSNAAAQQFQQEALSAAGIGSKLNIIA